MGSFKCPAASSGLVAPLVRGYPHPDQSHAFVGYRSARHRADRSLHHVHGLCRRRCVCRFTTPNYWSPMRARHSLLRSWLFHPMRSVFGRCGAVAMIVTAAW
jgi:hypothetical protein